MEVTNRIEEYIYRTLSNKAQAKIDAIWAPIHAEEDELKEQINEIAVEACNKVEALLADNEHFCVRKPKYYNNFTNFIGHINRKPGAFREECIITDNLRKKAKDEAERICLELEMGGSKADLESMMAEITF